MNTIKFGVTATLLGVSLITWGCEKDGEKGSKGVEVHTKDINGESQFFSFSAGDFVSTYDVAFSLLNNSYVVQLNSAAGVLAVVDTSAGFENATLPETGFRSDTTGFYVIGDEWMDLSTYNPADHSIQGNGNVYFIRAADYEWVKFSVLSASPTAFKIKYAVQESDSTFGQERIALVDYSEEASAYYDLGTGDVVEPGPWDVGFVTVPVYAPGQGTFFMPTVLLNYDRQVDVAIVTDVSFDELMSASGDETWLNDTGGVRNLGYLGPYEVLVYHHDIFKVLVENDEWVYIFKTDGEFFKLRFLEYSSGVLLFEYAQL